jgi:hypothetical protein
MFKYFLVLVFILALCTNVAGIYTSTFVDSLQGMWLTTDYHISYNGEDKRHDFLSHQFISIIGFNLAEHKAVVVVGSWLITTPFKVKGNTITLVVGPPTEAKFITFDGFLVKKGEDIELHLYSHYLPCQIFSRMK